MNSIDKQLQQMREKVLRADALREQTKRLKSARFRDDLGSFDADQVFEAGRSILIEQAEAELQSLFATPNPVPTVDSKAWELICPMLKCVGVFVGEGDDSGCQTPIAIVGDEKLAARFIEWHKSLPEDQQYGHLHAGPMRLVDGEFWNSFEEPDYSATRIPKD